MFKAAAPESKSSREGAKGTCARCGKALELRAVNAAGRDSYWFHMDTTNRGQKIHKARPAKVAA